MNTSEMIAVMQAFVDGKVVEFRSAYDGKWEPTSEPLWDWESTVYRVRPEPHAVYLRHASPGSGVAYVVYGTEREAVEASREYGGKVVKYVEEVSDAD